MCVTAFVATLLGAPRADLLLPGQEVQEVMVILLPKYKPQKK